MHKRLRMTHDTLVDLVGCSGGASRDRTDDLRVANATLSQLSYGPAYLLAEIVETISADTASLPVALQNATRTLRVVGLGGVEPPTSPLSGVRSNQLSYRPGGQASGGRGGLTN
jgi:hypothetical protein